jgi:hypothetical protein
MAAASSLRRRAEAAAPRRGRAQARARLPASAPRRLARRPGSAGPPWGARLRSGVRGGSGGSLTSLPGVLSASSFPRVRSAASAAAATASPTSPASRGAAAAAPRPRPSAPLLLALPLPLTLPARPGWVRGDRAGGCREPAAAPGPQSTARLCRGGRAAARAGGRGAPPPQEEGSGRPRQAVGRAGTPRAAPLRFL